MWSYLLNRRVSEDLDDDEVDSPENKPPARRNRTGKLQDFVPERRQSSRAAAVEATAKTKAALRAALVQSEEEHESIIEIGSSDDEPGNARR